MPIMKNQIQNEIHNLKEGRIFIAGHNGLVGSGKPRREFLHVDDLADACLFIMSLSTDVYSKHTSPRLSHLNIGIGSDVSITELAEIISRVVGCQGKIVYNREYPDGMKRKLLDVSAVSAIGWKARIGLEEGIAETYRWYRENLNGIN